MDGVFGGRGIRRVVIGRWGIWWVGQLVNKVVGEWGSRWEA